jgi:hypothetical protein
VKEFSQGLAWLGFWIGLGLYNFGGCSSALDRIAEVQKYKRTTENQIRGEK